MDKLSHAAIDTLLRRWLVQVPHNIAALGDHFPNYYDPQEGEWDIDGIWTEGFWTGILWWLYVYSKDQHFREWAAYYTRLLAARKAAFSDHDLGFLFYYSCVMECEITGQAEMSTAALTAAKWLAARYNPKGQFIPAHGAIDDPERGGFTIIDTIMNVPLLLWAHQQTGEQHYLDIVYATALKIADVHVRGDGSSCQVVWYNPQTGSLKRTDTLQGYDADSCWARGQAWGIAGFSRLHLHTGNPIFYDKAAAMARYFLSHLPADAVVSYDFDDPNPDIPKDTSAQAIAASGMVTLARCSTGTKRQYWIAAAERLIEQLLPYVVSENETGRGFLKEGCYFFAKQKGIHSDLIYGDYYLLEALLRYQSLRYVDTMP